MTVVGISSAPRPTPSFDRIVKRDDLLKVVPELDFLVVLTPLMPETRGIVGEKVFAAMKPSAFLVNVARGGVVDEPALIQALEDVYKRQISDCSIWANRARATRSWSRPPLPRSARRSARSPS